MRTARFLTIVGLVVCLVLAWGPFGDKADLIGIMGVLLGGMMLLALYCRR